MLGTAARVGVTVGDGAGAEAVVVAVGAVVVVAVDEAETGALTAAATGGGVGAGVGEGAAVVVEVVLAAGFFTTGLAAAFFRFGAVVRCVTSAERARIEAGRCAVSGFAAAFLVGAWAAGWETAWCEVVARCVAVEACRAVAAWVGAASCSDAMCVEPGTVVTWVLVVVEWACGFAGRARGGAASIVVLPASAIRTGRPPSAGPSSLPGRLTRTANAVATSAPASA
jgi:hypothetical protein